MEPGPAVLLRLNFDTTEQLARHLHLVDDSALLFVRDQRERFAAGEKLLIDLTVRDLGHEAAVRAEVVARSEGELRGSWLQAADTRLARYLRDKGSFAARRELRVSVADQLVLLCGESGTRVAGHLLDISPGGLRVRRVRGLSQGESCTVRLIGLPALDADLGRAHVTRTDGQEAGLRFEAHGSLPVTRYLRCLLEAWRLAPALDHPQDCCGPRGAIEPVLPALRLARHG